MDIKAGEYIRTSKGKIFKYGKGRAYLGKDNRIVKHSFNIIDLIETGDYVNGYKVLEIEDSIYKNSKRILIQDDIKTIVTKEQFEAMEYEV